MAPDRAAESDETYKVATRRLKSSKKSRHIIEPIDYTLKKAVRRNQAHTRSQSSKGVDDKATHHKCNQTKSGLKPTKTSSKTAAASELITRGREEGVLLESIIIDYSLRQAIPQPFNGVQKSTSSDANLQFHFLHKFGDPFTFLNVVRQWDRQLSKGTSKAWCLEWNIDEQVLKDLDRYVTRCCAHLNIVMDIELTFNNTCEETDTKLHSIMMEVYMDGLCVYRGHPDLGYWSVSKCRTIHLSSASVLSQLGTWNHFILALQDTSISDIIHSAIPVHLYSGQCLLDKNFRAAQEMLPLMTVVPVTLENIGQVVKDDLIHRLQLPGNDGLQQQILKKCESHNLILPDGKQKMSRNDLTIYVSPKDHDTTFNLLMKAVDEIKLQNEGMLVEMPYPTIYSPIRVLISAGGAVTQILLPHEFRSILVQKIHTDLSKDDVIKTLSVFGEIEQVVHYEKTHSKWIVVFKDPKSVQKVLSSYADLSNMLVELICPKPKEAEQLSLFTIDQSVTVKVKLCRRRFLTGKASVSFHGKQNHSNAVKTKKSFNICGVKFSGLKADGKGQFLLEGLDKVTKEEDVRDGLKSIDLYPDKVIFDRQPAFLCNSAELDKFKIGVTRVLDKVTDIRKVNVGVNHAKLDDIYLQGHIAFANQRIAVSALETLKQAKIQNVPLEIQVTEKSKGTAMVKVNVHNNLYKILKPELDHFSKIVTNRFEVDVQQTTSSEGVQFSLTNALPHKVDFALKEIQELLTPKSVCLSRWRYNYLTCGKGQHLLSAITAQTQTLFRLNRKQLDIYGSGKGKSDALELYQKYISERHYWFTLKLATICEDAGRVCECVAGLYQKYGPSLVELLTRCHLSCMVFDSSEKSFIYSSEDINAKDCLLHEMGTFAPESNTIVENKKLPECSACFCEPECEDSVFYLQSCKHAYCITCASQQIYHAIHSRKFPIVCSKENCEKPIYMKDLLFLADLAFKNGQEHLTKMAVEDYLTDNKKSWCFCYRPICEGLVSMESRVESYRCLSCFAKVCKLCQCQYHSSALNCENFKNEKALTQWFDSDKDYRKRCPNCKMGIEKIDGCNRVTCVACKKHICWECLAYFSAVELCYDHLNKEHGGY